TSLIGLASLSSSRRRGLRADVRWGLPACVDLTTIEDDDFARDFPAAGVAFDPIDIAAGAEDRHRAVLHRAHHEKIRYEVEGFRPLREVRDDLDRRDEVTVALRLV